MTMDALTWLQAWYLSRCDGEWEHSKGVRIDTLDNPGWSVEVDIGAAPTPAPIEEERSRHDWIKCEIRHGRFYGYGGPANLQEVLGVLRRWVEQSHPSRPANE